MALPSRAVAPLIRLKRVSAELDLQRTLATLQPLLAPFAAAWLVYVAIGILFQSPAFRVFAAGTLPASAFLRDAALALAPDSLLTATRGTPVGEIAVALYLVLAIAALASWCWAVRLARILQPSSLYPVLALTALLASPLLGYAGLFSDDVYLYNLYGRTISEYGSNPIIDAPQRFPFDSHLAWVHWKELPSSYGPLWLMLSSALSALGADSISAAVFAYRAAALTLHLLTASAIWYVLQRTRPHEALAGTLFYAWNPLVLIEVVANAHNDALVALFAVLLIAATIYRMWPAAAFFGACALMVKPFAILLLPALALRIVQTSSGRQRTRNLTLTCAIGVASVFIMSLPLWSGIRLVENISDNPASHVYTNTLWELISERGASWFGVAAGAIQHPYLDAIRTSGFIVGAVWILTRRRARRSVAHVALPLWLLFIVTAPWVWPWYFVPAIALAPLARGPGSAAAAALTAGGVLFWTSWPAPTALAPLFTWRSLVLFGPLVVTLGLAPVRRAILSAFGARARADGEGGDLLPAPLRSAPPPSGRTSSATAS